MHISGAIRGPENGVRSATGIDQTYGHVRQAIQPSGSGVDSPWVHSYQGFNRVTQRRHRFGSSSARLAICLASTCMRSSRSSPAHILPACTSPSATGSARRCFRRSPKSHGSTRNLRRALRDECDRWRPNTVRRPRRKHSAEFKAKVVAACRRPGGVDRRGGLEQWTQSNPLRRWVLAGKQAVVAKPITRRSSPAPLTVENRAFIPIQIQVEGPYPLAQWVGACGVRLQPLVALLGVLLHPPWAELTQPLILLRRENGFDLVARFDVRLDHLPT